MGLNVSEDLIFFELNLSEDLFCSLSNFGQKIGLILSGTIFYSDLCLSQIF